MVAATATMPVAPSTSSVGRYSYSSAYSSYRPSPSSSYANRTTSLDRSSYGTSSPVAKDSSYGSSGYSTYSVHSKYTRPPQRPSYSSTSDAYRSSRSVRVSPVRSSYSSRISSDSRVSGKDSNSDPKSRYSRESSLSKDSGYGSRLTSRDRSIDMVNGNGIDVSSFGPSPSSYAFNYRWEGKHFGKGYGEDGGLSPMVTGLLAGREAEDEEEKIRVSERIRSFEPKSIYEAREHELESIANRRRRLGLTVSPVRETKSRTPQPKRPSPEKPSRSAATEDNENKRYERRPSVTELCKKYDTNHNFSNGTTKSDEEDALPPYSSNYTAATSPKEEITVLRPGSPIYIRNRKRQESPSRPEPRASPSLPKEIVETRLSSPSTSLNLNDSSNHLRVASPARPIRDSSAKSLLESSSRCDSPVKREKEEAISLLSTSPISTTSSILTNGTTDKDEGGSPPSRRRSPTGGSSGSFSENSGLVGLRNIGNTCFLNSIVQCLSNTRFLMEYLVKDGYSSDINVSISTMKGDLVRAFAALLNDMWRDGGDPSRALNTGPFKSQIQKFAPAFSGYQQHDAQEFLRKLLEGLHEDVNRVVAKPRPITEDIHDDLDDSQKAIESWKRYLRYDDSKIVDMFVGQLKSCLECSVCGHSSVTFDPFWDLSLPIPSKSGQVRLAQCLDLFTKEEVLDGDERPTCSKCKERRKMTKRFSIQKFPKVLVLHLKRFSPLERWRGKLSCTVEFPLESLDLSRYTSNSTSNSIYNLLGVANHSGTTYSGHYTAYCKHPYSGTWHEYNDSRVSSISNSRVCSPEAYVLFYELSSSASKL